MRKRGVPWVEIGAKLNYSPTACAGQWFRLQDKGQQRRLFTEQEDALILSRAAEWGAPMVKFGLWAALEEELARPPASLSRRWKFLTSGKKQQNYRKLRAKQT